MPQHQDTSFHTDLSPVWKHAICTLLGYTMEYGEGLNIMKWVKFQDLWNMEEFMEWNLDHLANGGSTNNFITKNSLKHNTIRQLLVLWKFLHDPSTCLDQAHFISISNEAFRLWKINYCLEHQRGITPSSYKCIRTGFPSFQYRKRQHHTEYPMVTAIDIEDNLPPDIPPEKYLTTDCPDIDPGNSPPDISPEQYLTPHGPDIDPENAPPDIPLEYLTAEFLDIEPDLKHTEDSNVFPINDEVLETLYTQYSKYSPSNYESLVDRGANWTSAEIEIIFSADQPSQFQHDTSSNFKTGDPILDHAIELGQVFQLIEYMQNHDNKVIGSESISSTGEKNLTHEDQSDNKHSDWKCEDALVYVMSIIQILQCIYIDFHYYKYKVKINHNLNNLYLYDPSSTEHSTYSNNKVSFIKSTDEAYYYKNKWKHLPLTQSSQSIFNKCSTFTYQQQSSITCIKCIHHNIISLSEDHKETENAIIYGIYGSKVDGIAAFLEIPPEPPDIIQFISHIFIGRQTLLSSPKISRDNLSTHTHTQMITL